MIRGYIDPTGIPILPGFIRFPRLSLSGSVRFLVDTGSPASVISPADAENLGIHHSVLQGKREEISGFGGKCEVVLEDGVLYFKGTGENVRTCVTMEIIVPYEGSEQLPSIIGRDVLRSWKMIYEPLNESSPLVFHCNDRKLLW